MVGWDGVRQIPLVFDGFDDKAQSWTDRINVFFHNLFYDCGFAGIVEAEHEDAHFAVL